MLKKLKVKCGCVLTGSTYNVRSSYVWVLMTCLNHPYTPNSTSTTSLCFQEEIISWKYRRHSGSAKIIRSNRPPALHLTAEVCDVAGERRHFIQPIPSFMLLSRPFDPSPFRLLPNKPSLWRRLFLPRTAALETRRRDTDQAKLHPPSGPPHTHTHIHTHTIISHPGHSKWVCLPASHVRTLKVCCWHLWGMPRRAKNNKWYQKGNCVLHTVIVLI